MFLDDLVFVLTFQNLNHSNLMFALSYDFMLFSLQGDQYRKGVRGIPGNPGYFKMHFVNLRTGIHEKITLPQNISSSSRRYLFSMTKAASVTVDLDEGSILVHPEKSYGELNRDVVQNVALAFTVSLLYLVIQCNKRFIAKILIIDSMCELFN